MAIRSILWQTYGRWELLIIDDASSDNSVAIARGFDDSRIRVITHLFNRGLADTLNQALDLAIGDYFARMDQDDVAFPARLATQVAYMRDHPSVDLLATGILSFEGAGRARGILPMKEEHEEICRKPWAGFYMPHPTWLGRVEWFLKYRYRSFADKAEDQHLLFRAFAASRFACLSEVLLAYREEPRALGRKLATRRVLWRAFLWEALKARQYYVALRVCVLQPAKMLGDILNSKFGFRQLRRRVLPVPPALQESWEALWKAIDLR